MANWKIGQQSGSLYTLACSVNMGYLSCMRIVSKRSLLKAKIIETLNTFSVTLRPFVMIRCCEYHIWNENLTLNPLITNSFMRYWPWKPFSVKILKKSVFAKFFFVFARKSTLFNQCIIVSPITNISKATSNTRSTQEEKLEFLRRLELGWMQCPIYRRDLSAKFILQLRTWNVK